MRNIFAGLSSGHFGSPKAPGGRWKALVGTVLLSVYMRTQPSMPSISATSLVRCVFVLLAFRVGATDGNDPQAAARCDDQVEHVIGDGDADARQRFDHVGHDRDVVPVHADLDVDERHDRPEILDAFGRTRSSASAVVRR